MYLKYLQLVNYKNFKSSKFDFAKGANTIVGENDSGKSNAMTALRILLDDSFYYSVKRLKEDDFADSLGDWRGHWIIISAYFDQITKDDKNNEVCKDIVPEKENEIFLKSFIRCKDYDYGTVTLYIRPQKSIRKKLAIAKNDDEFREIRSKISLSDYEFAYTSRAQVDFTDYEEYLKIVGDINQFKYNDPDNDDSSIIGGKLDITEVWKYISVEFVDALRDVASDLKKPKSPIRRIVDTIKDDISTDDSEIIKSKIQEVNATISGVQQISGIGHQVNEKLNEMIGMVYSPDITIQSQMKDEIAALSRFLTLSPADKQDIDLLGLGHLNMLFIALKLVEFEVSRNNELMNIMIIEEPEAHIHTHIQRTLFSNLQVSKDFTQILMTTHSTHLSEVAEVDKINILRSCGNYSEVMQPSNGLNEFGVGELGLKGVSLIQCLERYLDAKRSVLLFSKGVILVEGDGEEILIPTLIKKAMGVSLDELGIGLINIGSVAFENVACIFDESRLKRHCAIITDLDQILAGAKKCSEEAAKRGESRHKKLEKLFKDNSFVNIYYAPYTLEVDFANEKDNHRYIDEIIDIHYSNKLIKKRHKTNLKKSDGSRYDSVLTVAKGMGKGWYATVLSDLICSAVIVPEYILDAIAFACQDIIDLQVKMKMIKYSLEEYNKNEKVESLISHFKSINSTEDKEQFVEAFIKELPNDVVSKFMQMVMKYES